jgi:hypothetical protein
MKTIEVIVNPKGETTVKTKGFTGTSCRDATKALERALGTVQSDTPTPEVHLSATTDQQLKQTTG